MRAFQFVDAAFVEEPNSALVRERARADTTNAPHGNGFALLVTSHSGQYVDGVARFRHIISGNPSSGVHLRGLGELLERREQEKEDANPFLLAKGWERVGPGKGRHGYNVASPWYDGRGHHFTIIDSPNIQIGEQRVIGSILTPEDILEVIREFGQLTGDVTVAA